MVGLALCFGAAALSYQMGLSEAYGAFIAGLIIGNSSKRDKITHAMEPIENILMMVFFLSIGLLMDLGFIFENFFTVMVLLLLVTVVKTTMNITILRVMGRAWPQAFMAGLILSQLGEFTFLLTSVASNVEILNSYNKDLIISVTVLSLAISPLWYASALRVHNLRRSGALSLSQIMQRAFGKEVALCQRGLIKSWNLCKRAISNIKRSVSNKE